MVKEYTIQPFLILKFYTQTQAITCGHYAITTLNSSTYMIESTSIVVLQVALRSVLFELVNAAGQTPSRQASPFTHVVF